MSKELEEAIKYIEKISKEWKTLDNTQIEVAKKLEIILQALKVSIPRKIVEDKIKKFKKEQSIELKGLKGQDRYFVKQIYESKINTLQEMLEEKNE